MRELSLDNPVHTCDPASDTFVEATVLREFGHVVPVVLFGGVPTWITASAEASRLIMDLNPDISRDSANWAALRRGEVPDTWPMLSLVTGRNLANTDGADHMRLRRLVTHAFTNKRIAAVVPRLNEIADELLDTLADHHDPIDLKASYAYPLPMRMLCEFFGITDEDERGELTRVYGILFDAGAADEERTRAGTDLEDALTRHIADKRAHPDDRLTSTLIRVRDEDGDRLTERELTDTLQVIFAAGNETTVNAIANDVVGLLTHPDQLALLRDGTHPWSATVDAGLHWNAPLKCVYMRYALRDTDVCGTVVRAGEPIATMIAGAHRNGGIVDEPERFDITRTYRGHVGFGAGPHFCVGAPLARQEIAIGLERLFTRFPALRLAVTPDRLTKIVSPAINGLVDLPVVLT
ncbi:cytochrome P450 family protein [Actinophytocola oryzae]|uniref:Cytochrome P450 n=1 Tax=Actinophytocola oryzae TaxID=502181 RepID=A0A4R7W387_9PSEU|nr:cytochrome P450 [Actinophytocola oryzae]TDV56625.1 cytochrome P450 [Actinophytocola oryzae]